MNERILIVRLGAFGDCIIITPLLRHLKSQGHEVYVLTSEQGMEMLSNNPNVDKLIPHPKDSVIMEKLGPYFHNIKEAYECDRMIDLCESIECNLCLYPAQPSYNWDRLERKKKANKNYYEETFRFAKVPVKVSRETMKPDLFFTDEEKTKNAEFRSNYIGKRIIVWGLAGSSIHKSFPYTHIVMSHFLEKYPDIHFVTVGDEKCEILEQALRHDRVIFKSNKWTIREAMLMIKNSYAVIAPDTGLLHASGCYDVPKIGLMTSTSITNISKYFENNYSIQAKMPCAPCYRLIYDANIQCPVDKALGTPFCNAYGISPEEVIDELEKIITDKQTKQYERAKRELLNA